MLDYAIGQGYSALDAQAWRDKLDGYAVASGLGVSVDTGLTLSVAAGTATVGETSGSVDTVTLGSATSVTLSTADASNPRKDTVYIDTAGAVQVETGTPEAANPSGNTQFDTFEPEPPFPSSEGVILAEVWVGAGASSLSSTDIRDRRVPADVVADRVVSRSAEVGSLSGTYVGDVRAFADGEVIASIDPSSTTTPVQDAIDAITATTSGFGRVVLPPGTITESAPVTMASGIEVVGQGIRVSTIEFTDLESDGFVFPSVYLTYLGEFRIDGSDGSSRTGGSAIRWTTGDGSNNNMGAVRLTNWIDPNMHFDTGHPYSSHWKQIYSEGAGSRACVGRVLLAEDSVGPGLTVDNWYSSLGDASPVIQLRTDAGGSVTDGGINIGSLNVGGSASAALVHSVASNGAVKVGAIHWYPDGASSVVRIRGNAATHIGAIHLDTVTVDQAVEYFDAFHGNSFIGRISDNGATYNNAKVNVTADGVASHVYAGDSSEVTNTSGGTLSGSPISCLGDLNQVT